MLKALVMIGIALTAATALAPVATADHDIWVDTALLRGGAYTDPLPRLVGCAPGWLPAGLGYAHVCV